MKNNLSKTIIISILILLLLVLVTSCYSLCTNRFERIATKYLKDFSIICSPENIYFSDEDEAEKQLSLYLWHMTESKQDISITLDKSNNYFVIECNSFTLDGLVFNDSEYPYTDIKIQVFFDSQKSNEPILSVIKVEKYFKDNYGTFYYPISIKSNDLKNELYFAGYSLEP